jgi:WD40 repeat protein
MPGVTADAAAVRTWGLMIPEYPMALAWVGTRTSDVALLSSEGTLSLLDAVAGEGRWRSAAHDGGACALAVSPDGTRIASGGHDGFVRLWSSEDGRALGELEIKGWVEHLAWTPDGRRLAAAAGREVHLLTPDGDRTQRLGPHGSTVAGISWRRDGAQLAVAHYGGATLWAPDVAEPQRRLERKGSILSVAWHPKGRHLAAGCQDQAVQVWNMRAEQHLYMSGYMTKLTTITWDESGRYLATAGGPGATIWDFSGAGPEGSKPVGLGKHEELLTALAWAPRRPLIVTADSAGRVQLWRIDGKRAEQLARLEMGIAVTAVAWAPNGRHLVVAGEDGAIDGFAIRAF